MTSRDGETSRVRVCPPYYQHILLLLLLLHIFFLQQLTPFPHTSFSPNIHLISPFPFMDLSFLLPPPPLPASSHSHIIPPSLPPPFLPTSYASLLLTSFTPSFLPANHTPCSLSFPPSLSPSYSSHSSSLRSIPYPSLLPSLPPFPQHETPFLPSLQTTNTTFFPPSLPPALVHALLPSTIRTRLALFTSFV